MTSPAVSAKTVAQKADLPWSYQYNAWIRALICIVTGIAAGVCGTLVHRLGAQYNVPIGLILALLIIGISAWSARARSGVVGLGLHLIASSGVIAVASITATSGDILLPMGFYSSRIPFFSQNAFWFWFFGMIVIQFVMVFLPRSLFVIPAPKKASVGRRDAAQADSASREVAQA
ncbi:alcohol dehydrogenase [Bifidobacterium sp. ESL0784]|uniref:alcohol dehydrogenase n=1 Tax=Bifidobacterium sp. ESL0784 TaxID=2983231 RepID=UPI0023F8ECE0|nr:alcohol dehydrogenase [Bifidobacterium sp. ESL0784]MDF7641154.1 alcohol dehydrogenase [Bifidobacterium sp. ESL0784]